MCAAKIHMMVLIINYYESVECSRYTSRKTRSGILSVFFENNTYISLHPVILKRLYQIKLFANFIIQLQYIKMISIFHLKLKPFFLQIDPYLAGTRKKTDKHIRTQSMIRRTIYCRACIKSVSEVKVIAKPGKEKFM